MRAVSPGCPSASRLVSPRRHNTEHENRCVRRAVGRTTSAASSAPRCSRPTRSPTSLRTSTRCPPRPGASLRTPEPSALPASRRACFRRKARRVAPLLMRAGGGQASLHTDGALNVGLCVLHSAEMLSGGFNWIFFGFVIDLLLEAKPALLSYIDDARIVGWINMVPNDVIYLVRRPPPAQPYIAGKVLGFRCAAVGGMECEAEWGCALVGWGGVGRTGETRRAAAGSRGARPPGGRRWPRCACCWAVSSSSRSSGSSSCLSPPSRSHTHTKSPLQVRADGARESVSCGGALGQSSSAARRRRETMRASSGGFRNSSRVECDARCAPATASARRSEREARARTAAARRGFLAPAPGSRGPARREQGRIPRRRRLSRRGAALRSDRGPARSARGWAPRGGRGPLEATSLTALLPRCWGGRVGGGGVADRDRQAGRHGVLLQEVRVPGAGGVPRLRRHHERPPRQQAPRVAAPASFPRSPRRRRRACRRGACVLAVLCCRQGSAGQAAVIDASVGCPHPPTRPPARRPVCLGSSPMMRRACHGPRVGGWM